MLHVGTDRLDVIGSFNFQTKESRDGRVYIYALATGAAALLVPRFVQFKGSTYEATELQASYTGRVGVPIAAIASGCMGWFQIRGFCSNVQGAGSALKGSFGHAVYCSAAGVAASDGTYTGKREQFAILAEDVGGDASTTANMWLLGRDDITPLA